MAWAATCKACWFLVPRATRVAFFGAPQGSQERANALAGCLAAIRSDPRFHRRAKSQQAHANQRRPNERLTVSKAA